MDEQKQENEIEGQIGQNRMARQIQTNITEMNCQKYDRIKQISDMAKWDR